MVADQRAAGRAGPAGHPGVRTARRVYGHRPGPACHRAKADPADIARIALDGIAAGEAEIVADETGKRVLAALSSGVRGLYPQLA